MKKPLVDPSQLTFLAGGGEMGARMREMDWSGTALGPPDTWPQSLRSTVSMLLPSKAQIALFWGPEFNILYNDAYRPVFGAKHPDALGRPGSQAWSEIWDAQVGLHALLDGVVRTGEAFWAHDLLFVLERYGFVEDTYFDVSYDPVRVESGTVGGVFCIVTETTERVVGERRLALLRDLAARNATARTERDACVLAMETLAARPDVAFALAYLDDELQAATPDAERQRAAAPPELVKTLSLPSSSGPAGRLVVGINPRRPFDDGYRSFIGLVADQVATALINARAYEAERQRAEALAAIDRAKTIFFSNVSHEFRTPLTLLVGPLEDALADTTPAPPSHRARVEIAHRNALRLLRLVNTLLDFSRIEAGRIDASYEPTDLASLTADLASAFRSAVEKAGLALNVDCPPLPCPVYVDRDMWEKIVLNLLSNAFKFTFEGEIRVELRWRKDHVDLHVRDTGVGIPAEDVAKVFERFHRVKHARSRTHEGTGIGLTLVHELVRLHGGTASVASEVGRGTTFTVSVPTGTAHLPADRISAARQLESTAIGATPYVEEALRWMPHAEHPGSAAESLTGRHDHERILIADDNADMRDYLARILGAQYRVELAADGRAALDRIRANAPALVVADVMMPALDGFELLAALRADTSTQHVPVVLLSARAGEEAALRGIEAGADDYVVKPFSARDLLARVEAQIARKKTREAVRERMAQIESLINHAPLGVYLVDQDFRIAHVNPVAAPVFGDIPGLVGGDFDDVIHRLWTKEYADEITAMFRRTLDTGEPYVASERAELRIDRGVVEYYDWLVVRISLPDGRFGVVCYFRDVSEQVEARRAIERSEESFRAFVTATSDAVYRMSPDWSEMRFLEGRNFIEDTTSPNRGWIGKYIHPDDQPAVRAAIRAAIDAKTTFELEHRVFRVDGTLGWTLSRAVPLLDERGEIAEWLGSARDVTARRERDEAFARLTADSAQRRRLYETILSTTPDLIYVFGLDHRFTYANRALLAMWGKRWEDAIGKNCLELGYEPWHAEMHDREIDQVIATGQPIRGEVPFTGTHGRRTYDYIFVPVFDAAGNVEAIAGTTRDVTDRKRSEDALRDSEQRLAEANRAKDDFLAMLGHELRNPLAPILTAVQLMRLRGISAAEGERQVIERQVERLVSLVDDLLDVSRITRGKVQLNCSPIEVSQIVASAIETASPLLEQKQHDLRVDVPTRGLAVNGDAPRLAQVVSNLLTNAAKYTESGGRIVVTAAAVGDEVMLRVTDTGIGIAPDIVPHIFDLFVQERQALDRAQGGLGLGLAIVRSLVTLHGGRVEAHSGGPGHGSEFLVWLPRTQADVRPRADKPPADPVQKADRVRRVLVVDDNSDAAAMLTDALGVYGHVVATAADGLKALQVAREFKPDVALLDIGLPVIDGYDLAKRFAGDPDLRSVRLIAVTGYGQEQDLRRSREAGFVAHMVKPLKFEELRRLVETEGSSLQPHS